MDTKNLGLLAEGVARYYLIKKGYKILAANYEMGFGEIDIIAQKNNTVTFAEVKAVSNRYEGLEPELRVDYQKKKQLIRLATAYMLNQKMTELAWQIDIISVIFDLENKKARIKHFKRAVTE